MPNIIFVQENDIFGNYNSKSGLSLYISKKNNECFYKLKFNDKEYNGHISFSNDNSVIYLEGIQWKYYNLNGMEQEIPNKVEVHSYNFPLVIINRGDWINDFTIFPDIYDKYIFLYKE
jgi:hypothetical protein